MSKIAMAFLIIGAFLFAGAVGYVLLDIAAEFVLMALDGNGAAILGLMYFVGLLSLLIGTVAGLLANESAT